MKIKITYTVDEVKEIVKAKALTDYPMSMDDKDVWVDNGYSYNDWTVEISDRVPVEEETEEYGERLLKKRQ